MRAGSVAFEDAFEGVAAGQATRVVDAGELVNVVTADGNDPNGDPVTDDDTNTVPIDQNPAIQIVKTNEGVADGGGPLAGDEVPVARVLADVGLVGRQLGDQRLLCHRAAGGHQGLGHEERNDVRVPAGGRFDAERK